MHFTVVDGFHILLHGRVAITKVTPWGKLRALFVGYKAPKAGEEVLIEELGADNGYPFFGEQALLEEPSYAILDLQGARAIHSDTAVHSVRAASPTALLLRLRRSEASAFVAAVPEWGELLMLQRKELLSLPLREVELAQVVEKERFNGAASRAALVDALRLHQEFEVVRLKQLAEAQRNPAFMPRVPRPPPPPHVFGFYKPARTGVVDESRQAMEESMQVFSVAARLGLVDDEAPTPLTLNPSKAPEHAREKWLSHGQAKFSRAVVDLAAEHDLKWKAAPAAAQW